MMNQTDNKNETIDTLDQQTAHHNENQTTVEQNSQEASFKEQFLRVSSDFANFRRRTEKERADLIVMAQGMILEKMLPIFDELDRAIEMASNNTNNDASWIEGFKLVQKNWQKLFTELQIEEIAQTGTFDPELHEGLVQVEDTSKESGSLAQTFSKGYRFKGKVIRHAKVSVVK